MSSSQQVVVAQATMRDRMKLLMCWRKPGHSSSPRLESVPAPGTKNKLQKNKKTSQKPKSGQATAEKPGKKNKKTVNGETTSKKKKKVTKDAGEKKGKKQTTSTKTKNKPKKTLPKSNKLTPEEKALAEEYKDANPSKWKLSEVKFAGAATYEERGYEEQVQGQSIAKAIEMFKANPVKYTALRYQTSMLDWPVENQAYALLHRAGTKNFQPTGVSPSGWMTVWIHEYQCLPPHPNNLLPKPHRDAYTDKMTFRGKRLHSKQVKPILPGRGMGICDQPNLKIIGDVDPSDIHQGEVGNCWLLSAISSLAEFDGAVKKLFRKTRHLDQMPFDNKPNLYTITLWDLKTWKEVDIVIDERLAVSPTNGPGQLLGSKPSVDGELWVCYLEKALAIHCGGWDKLVGGQCTHGWALLTGCQQQYTIQKDKRTGKFTCCGKYDPAKKKWLGIENAPNDGDRRLWNVDWPAVGGGGNAELLLTQDELFDRMVAWDEENYIVSAGTSGTSDKHSTGGLVDNHAYSVIQSFKNVCGTGKDLLQVRNPWGSGEIEDGEFDDDGPGWKKYPQIKKKLKPVEADDGIFWVTKEEFFHFFETVFLSASNMTEFLED